MRASAVDPRRDGVRRTPTAHAAREVRVTTALLRWAAEDLQHGRWDSARHLAADAAARARTLGDAPREWIAHTIGAAVAAHRGERDEASAVCERMMQWAVAHGVREMTNWGHHVLARAAVGVGDFETAYAHGIRIAPSGSAPAWHSAGDLVEAALHSGRATLARAHVCALRAAGPAPHAGSLRIELATARALVADECDAPERFAAALGIPGLDRWPFAAARARLAFGERLRRARRHRAARDLLRAAADAFAQLGAVPWHARATAELRATAENRRSRHDGADALTPQEDAIVRLAARGLTNREIASRLLLSPHTVSAHLYRAYPKLGVTSRAALGAALAGDGDAPASVRRM